MGGWNITRLPVSVNRHFDFLSIAAMSVEIERVDSTFLKWMITADRDAPFSGVFGGGTIHEIITSWTISLLE